jgi:hypothetical protein
MLQSSIQLSIQSSRHSGVLFFLIFFTSFILISSFFSGTGNTAQTMLAWSPPTTNEDGTPITDISGYKVYFGTSPGQYAQTIYTGNVTNYNVTNLTEGTTYYFAVTTVNSSSKESIYSNEIIRVIAVSSQFKLSVTRVGTGSGTVTSTPPGISCGSDCTEAYNAGASVTLTAAPDAASVFAGWSGACGGTGSCTVVMDAAKSVSATFTGKTYTIKASAGAGGSISPSGSLTVNHGASRTFTITPDANYYIADVLIDGYSAGAVSTYTFPNVTANHSINASFKKQQENTLSVTRAGTGSGTVTSTPPGISCGSDCTEAYNAGASVTLTAAPDAASVFAGWSGACGGTGSCTVVMDAAKSVSATFTGKTYTIKASAGAGGSISPSGSVTVNHGASRTFTITPDANYYIADVLIDGYSAGAVSTYTFPNVTANHSINASFKKQQENTLSVTRAGTGSGTVTSTPPGISCGSDCTEAYNAGASVTLTAAPDAASVFAGWSGACGGTGSCTVVMDAAKSVSATFTGKTYTIKASAGAGGSISPSGSVTVNHGASRTFTITPDANYYIADVLIDGYSAGAVSTYTFPNVTANHSINASFKKQQENTLSVTRAGTGSGTVTSTPPGISCGSDCTEAYNAGASVTLTAAPDAASVFAGWSGACGGTGSCTVVMDAAKSVSATFTGKTYTIKASAGAGGSISPSGSLKINRTDNQTFTIVPNADFRIDNVVVDGNAIGAVDTYTFMSVEAEHTIHAIFVKKLDSINDEAPYEPPTNEEDVVPAEEAEETEEFFTLPKTGQTISYASGDDGDIQAGVEWPALRFVDNGDGTVTDTLTGLMWLKDGSCLSRKKWSNALQTFVEFNTVPELYGCSEYTNHYADWRLPNIRELKSLINFGVMDTSAWLSTNGFSNINPSPYWSSTTSAIKKEAFTVNLYNGIETSLPQSRYSYIIAVRDPSVTNSQKIPESIQTVTYASGDDGDVQAGLEWPEPRFVDNKDGTVTDTLTGLMWLRDGSCLKKKKWNDALHTVANFNIAPDLYSCSEYNNHHTDWRLPNITELESLVNYGIANNTSWLNEGGFYSVKTFYWSSTASNANPSQAYALSLKNIKVLLKGTGVKYNVLPVRSASSFSP